MFIELTDIMPAYSETGKEVVSINVNQIVSYSRLYGSDSDLLGTKIVTGVDVGWYAVEESYEQVKQAIKEVMK